MSPEAPCPGRSCPAKPFAPAICSRRHTYQYVSESVPPKATTHAEAVDTNVVADGGQILHSFADQGPNQILGDAAQSESAHHDDRAVEHVANGFIGIGNNFVHESDLKQNYHRGHRGTREATT